MKLNRFLAAACAVAALSTASAQAMMMPGHIRVDACVPNQGTPSQTWIGPWGGMNTNLGTPATLTIHYANESPKPAASIEFALVANQRALALVRDVGTFSTGAEIRHVFNIANNIGFIGTDLTYCVPVRIHYKDGSVWSNPQLPSKPPVM
jgi:hypothetical protein